jgi:hypothetical protein
LAEDTLGRTHNQAAADDELSGTSDWPKFSTPIKAIMRDRGVKYERWTIQ